MSTKSEVILNYKTKLLRVSEIAELSNISINKAAEIIKECNSINGRRRKNKS